MTRDPAPGYCRRVQAARIIILTYGILTATFALPALAETACVRCDGPAAAYECNTYSSEPIADTAVALFCTGRIASDYGHKSCAVVKAQSECNGLAVHLDYTAEPETIEPAAAEAASEEKEPETLGELAQDTYDASKQTVEKTGEAIGDAANSAGQAMKDAGDTIKETTRKTLSCLGSALSDC